MIHIAICDDNKIHLEAAQALLSGCAARDGTEVELHAFSHGEELLAALEAGTEIQIAILDIQMDGMSGISAAKRLNQADGKCQIVYLTGFVDYVMDVYESKHVYLVLKSRMKDRLWPAVRTAMELYRALENDSVTLRTASGTDIVQYDDILYFERRNRKTYILTAGEELSSYQSLEELLPDESSGRFIRCHKSFAVNPDCVRRLEADCFLLRSGQRIPISRAYKRTAVETFWKRKNAEVLGG